MKSKLSLVASIAICTSVFANETIELDKMSVTATKVERATKEVTESIAVVDKKEIEDKIS